MTFTAQIDTSDEMLSSISLSPDYWQEGGSESLTSTGSVSLTLEVEAPNVPGFYYFVYVK